MLWRHVATSTSTAGLEENYSTNDQYDNDMKPRSRRECFFSFFFTKLFFFSFSPECHQAAFDLIRIFHKELLRKAFLDWSSWEQCQELLVNLKTEGADFTTVVHALQDNFELWKKDREQSGLEVAKMVLQFMEAAEILELYDFGIKKEKPMLNEMLLIEMLPMWCLFGKTRYFDN